MPIRKEWREHYRTPAFRRARDLAKVRSCGFCERCGAPDRELVFRLPGGFWWDETLDTWRDRHCRPAPGPHPGSRGWLRAKPVLVILTSAHLDHDPANNAEANVARLCQWCHNTHDLPFRAETRKIRKDRERPLLAAITQTTQANEVGTCSQQLISTNPMSARSPTP